MLTWLTFNWVFKIMYKAYKSELTSEDVWDMDEPNSCEYLSNDFEHNWNAFADKSLKQSKPSLLLFLAKYNRKSILLSGLLRLVTESLTVVDPLILK